MGIRKVTGIVKENDLPLINATIRFRLHPGSYTSNSQFISFVKSVETNELGYFEANLWTNEEGEIESIYACYLPDGDQFTFTLPVGSSDIDLSVLRQMGITQNDPQYNTLITYVDQRIASVEGRTAVRDILSPSNQPNFQLSAIPSNPQMVELYINGLKQLFGIDFNINSSILQWLGDPIETNSYIEVLY